MAKSNKFDKKSLEEMSKALGKQAEITAGMNQSMGKYLDTIKLIGDLTKNINSIEAERAAMQKVNQELSDEILKLSKATKNETIEETKERQKLLKLLKKEKTAKEVSLAISGLELEQLKKKKDEYVESAKQVNKINLGLKAGVGFLKQTPGLIKKGFGKLKGTGIFDIDKATRMAAQEMGFMGKSSDAFAKHLNKASEKTWDIGINTKEIAKIQAGYSAELGKSTMLTQEGVEAIGAMANGTALGMEGAAAMAAEMGKFNISAKQSGELVGEVMNMSETMGVNSTKVLKELQNNLKMANKYHFKGGVKGMAEMAAQATRFNTTMEMTAGFADKVFDIEGAVEMSAKLNAMGGEWAKLGDPMKLMYQARNDMEGLQESVIAATSGMADFNSETGEFEFSGLDLARMRELEKITGISAEQMAEMAKQKAKFDKVGDDLGGVSDKMRKFVESNAEYNKDTGKYEIQITGQEKAIPVDELGAMHEKIMAHEEKTLKDRAKDSQTFDDDMSNLITQFKSLLLPFIKELKNFTPVIKEAFETFRKSGFIDTIKESAESIGKVIVSIGKFFSESPKLLTGALVGLGLFKLATWYANGVSMGLGFNSMTSGSGGGSGGGMFGKLTKGGGFGKNLGKAAKSGGAMLGGVLAAGTSGYDEWTENSANGMDTGENVGRTGTRAASAGLGAWGGAALGAAIGTAIFPVVGTAIGGLIGGIAGGMGGDYIGDRGGDLIFGNNSQGASKGPSMNDGVIMNGKVHPIHDNDTALIGKTGGPFDSVIKDNKQNGDSTNNNNKTAKVHITFGDILVKSDGNTGKISLQNDSQFMAMLGTEIRKAMSKTANGGVLSPNPL